MRNIGESKIYIVPELSADNEQWINPDFGNPNLQTPVSYTHLDVYKRQAQIQSADCQSLKITQEVPAQIQDVAKTVSARCV